jgi:uncharacterized protein YkwD
MIRLTSFAALLLLAASAAPALAEVQFAIGEPAEGSIKSGIGQISGWAVSDREIVSVEAFIDGASLGLVPYGGSRLDVADAFPQYSDAEHSGWSMKWNYALHEPGEHVLTMVFTEDDGSQTIQERLFSTTRFHAEFISDPAAVRTEEALVSSPARGRLRIEGAEVEGEIVDLELAWDRAAQQFQIDTISYAGQQPKNQSPHAAAGPDQTVETGAAVTVAGGGTDPDGRIANQTWSQVYGPGVTLTGADQWVVEFTAPSQPGDVRLRLTVTDDDGATDTDDVVITVEEAPDPGNTTGSTLQSMLDDLNDARGQEQDCGGTLYPAQPPLQWSSSLADIAMRHSMDMAQNGYFSHTSLDGTSMGSRVFPYWNGTTVGENIAASSVDRSDNYVVDLWLDSPGHCALLMDPDFTHVGVGKGYDPDNGYTYKYFWTMDVGG